MASRTTDIRRGRRMWIVVACVFILAAAAATVKWRLGARHSAGDVAAAGGMPTAEIVRGELVDTVELRGQITPVRSVLLVAPPDAGDIQILQIAKDGSMVHQGDVVIVFDSTTLQNTLSQRRSDLEQAEAQVADTKAKGKLAEQQDLTDLQKANFDVESARLDASEAEILSPIDGAEKRLALADAEQKAKQAQQKLDSDVASSSADVNDIDQKRIKALRDVQHYEDAISHLTIRAPVDGMVHALPNWRAGGVFGDNAPPFKQGDRAWALAQIVELPDLTSLRINARLEEEDRGRIASGETVTARVDAVPDHELTGRVTDISPLAKVDFSNGWPPARNFDLTVALDHPDERLRPGMSVTERIAVQRIPDVILAPAEAVFSINGSDVVYVQQGSKASNSFVERPVVVGRRGGGQVEIKSGLQPGQRIALKNPVAKQ